MVIIDTSHYHYGEIIAHVSEALTAEHARSVAAHAVTEEGLALNHQGLDAEEVDIYETDPGSYTITYVYGA